MSETVERNNRFYEQPDGKILTENEQLTEWLKIANESNDYFRKENVRLINREKELLREIHNKINEIERLKQEHETIKKYVHNHTITYIDNGIECCKPDEYFNISWVEDMLNGNFKNLESLFEESDKE